MPRPRRSLPREASLDWPTEPCGDPVAETVRLLAVRTLQVMAGRSQQDVADACGIDRSAVSDLLAGRSWPDVQTLARLELGLGEQLWPGSH